MSVSAPNAWITTPGINPVPWHRIAVPDLDGRRADHDPLAGEPLGRNLAGHEIGHRMAGIVAGSIEKSMR
jgi:hypothetical protein